MSLSDQDTEEPSVVRIDITPRSVLLVLGAVALVWLAYRLWVVALVLAVALILAGTFNPIAEWLDRHGLTRTQSLIALFAGLLVGTVALGFLMVPPLVDQFTQMVEQAPATRDRLAALLGERGVTRPLAHMLQSPGVTQMFSNAETSVLGYSSQAMRAFGYGVTALVLAFYLLADGKRAQGVVYAIVPRAYHMRLARIIQNMETIVGGYIRAQLLTSIVFGAFTFVLLFFCKVPNAMSMALFAALVDVIPVIGAMIVIVPAVLSALPLGLPVAGIVLLALTVYIEFEARILIPRVYGQYLRLSSTAVILALLAGGLLMGVLGALLALPLASGLLMVLDELRVDLPGDDRVDRKLNARLARTEATYEQMSAGASAPDAGEIAKALAAELRDAEVAAAAREAERAAAKEAVGEAVKQAVRDLP